jgi:hypothetical protein
LIQSNYNQPQHPGDLFSIARTGEVLYYFFMDSSVSPPKWNGPFLLTVDGGGSLRRNVGIPSLIQSTYGNKGNFELVVPITDGGFMYYYRDNNVTGTQPPRWRQLGSSRFIF